MFPGYLSGQAQPFTEDGWLISGDIGFRGADNRLVVTGRAKDIIIRSGHNIDPAVIEEAAVKHSAVGIAAAVGMHEWHDLVDDPRFVCPVPARALLQREVGARPGLRVERVDAIQLHPPAHMV